MASCANLVVNITFNPPEIVVIGPVKDTTIQKLEQIVPQVCTTSPGQKGIGRFQKMDTPPHWFCRLSSHYCNEEMGQTQIMLKVMDCLEDEGGWKLKASNAINHDETKVTYKFFFSQKL